jgi:phage shock protein C
MRQDVKRVFRERDEAQLGGVCAGLGTYLGVDPVIVRIVWILVTVFTGFVFGIVAYALAWIIVPRSPVPGAPAGPVGGAAGG